MNAGIQSAGALQSDPIGNAIGEVIVARQATEEALRSAQSALEIVERENVELRKQLVAASFEYFTEEEAAARLGVSKDFLVSLRKRKKIPVVKLSPRVYRHTTETLVRIAELLEVKPKPELAKAQKRVA